MHREYNTQIKDTQGLKKNTSIINNFINGLNYFHVKNNFYKKTLRKIPRMLL